MSEKNANEKIKGIKNLKKLSPYLKKVRGKIIVQILIDLVGFGVAIVVPLITARILAMFTDFNFGQIISLACSWCGANLVMIVTGQIS